MINKFEIKIDGPYVICEDCNKKIYCNEEHYISHVIKMIPTETIQRWNYCLTCGLKHYPYLKDKIPQT